MSVVHSACASSSSPATRCSRARARVPFSCVSSCLSASSYDARACAGSFVATRLVYGEGITHVEALGKDPSRLAAAATTYVGAQRDVSQLQEKVLASSLDEAVKTDVLKLLRPSLS